MDNSTANLYWVKAKRETRSRAPMASFSQDGFQRWANTYGVAREEGFANEDFQEGEPRVQRKPNMERKLERTPPNVELKAFDQELKPAEQRTGGSGLHEHARFETEDLGSQMRVFLNPQAPEHFSNESKDAMKATVAKAKKAHGGTRKKRGGKKPDVGPVPLEAPQRWASEGTAVFSSGKDKTDQTPDATNIVQPSKRLYKKRPGKTLDLVKDAREEQKSLLGGRVNPVAMSALLKTLKDDPGKVTDKLSDIASTVKKATKPLKMGLKMVAPFAGDYKPVVSGLVAGMDALGLGQGGVEEKEGGARKKKVHASKGKKSARGALVSKIMKERKVSLGEASKIIKAEKLL